ncbi:hypothetical protein CEXT_297251 [Caerostris extrusa]|uniref:Secreted protein n=1 Tax=Caerostris extrusa TaxID=172846 RepID=A0AAV4MEZ1_CAEEX|nr:hypothetical protein CEXT_297251 [Caerostris extrusa]
MILMLFQLLSVMDGLTGVVQKLSAEECLEVGYPYILPTLSSAAVCPQLPLLSSPNTAEAAVTAQSSSILIHRVVTCHRLFFITVCLPMHASSKTKNI